jgi:hypothetical protein
MLTLVSSCALGCDVGEVANWTESEGELMERSVAKRSQ